MDADDIIAHMGDTKYIHKYVGIIKTPNKYSDEYTERHHILPKSLFPEFRSMAKDSENIVRLSAREHYVCHFLLYKHYKSLGDSDGMHKMATAWHCMSITRSSRKYVLSRKAHGEAQSARVSGKNNPMYGKKSGFAGKKHTEETLEKLRGPRDLSEESRKRYSAVAKKRTYSDETRKKLSDSAKKRKTSDATKAKLSKMAKGRIWMCDPNGVTVLVYPTEFNKYSMMGYTKGRKYKRKIL